MAGEEKKDFNAMLHRDAGMPKIQIVTDRATIEKYGGERMFFAPPLAYDEIMKKVPRGKVLTVGAIRAFLAERGGADFTDPITAGIFVSIAAWASEQRRGPNALLANAEGGRRAEPQIPGRGGSPKRKAGGRGAHRCAKGQKKPEVLCAGL